MNTKFTILNRQLKHSEVERSKVKYPIVVLANNIIDPLNVGSLFRTADALGVEKIYLTGLTPDPQNPKVKRTSRSTVNHVSWEYSEDPIVLVRQLKIDGYKIVSLEITNTSFNIRDFKVSPNDKICLIPGSENGGVAQSILDLSDFTIHIPMHGNNSSMNVAVACAIAVFEITGKL